MLTVVKTKPHNKFKKKCSLLYGNEKSVFKIKQPKKQIIQKFQINRVIEYFEQKKMSQKKKVFFFVSVF